MFVNLSTLLFPLYFVASFSLISSQKYEYDSTIKTMEDFSGYPFQEHGFKDSSSALSVDIESLQRQIDELASFSDTPAPSVTRVLYSEKDVLARRYIKNLMGLAGLSVKEDAVGNIFGRWEGSEPEIDAVSTGSHIDAIPYSGKYDGVVGVLGAIEAINALKRITIEGWFPWVSVKLEGDGGWIHPDEASDLLVNNEVEYSDIQLASIRQPSPPPVLAKISDPRYGTSEFAQDGLHFTNSYHDLHISVRLMEDFFEICICDKCTSISVIVK